VDLCLVDWIFSFLVAVLIILIVVKNASVLKLIDIPNERSSHDTPKPRGAGIAIYLSFIVSILLFFNDFFIENITFFISLSLIFLVGVYDDVKGVKPRVKFLVISIAVTLLFFIDNLSIDSLGVWFGYEVNFPMIVSLAFTIFAITGYTNALNLIDGLDGLAGGISLVIFLSFLYLGFVYDDNFVIYVSFFMSSALFAFLFFNWYPAKIFMGDSGSLVLGFVISVVAIRLTEQINIVSVLFLASLPILDTIMVMVRRMQRSLSPFSPDKSHIHHKLLRWKTEVDYTVMLIILMQVSFSLLGILLVDQNNVLNTITYAVILYIFFNIFDDRKINRKEILLKGHTKVTNILIESRYSYPLVAVVIVLLLLLKYFL